MSRFERLLRVAQSATPERLERVEQAVYPYAARGMRDGRLLDSQLEALLKALSASSGVGVRAITRAYRAVATADPDRNKGVEGAGPYFIKNGAICHEKATNSGPIAAPLCNFTAHIVEERERDDGVEQSRVFVISGRLANGQVLPEAEVAAQHFAAMGWPVAAWGTRAVVYAGQGTKDHLRTAVQMISGDVPRRTTYTHLGWREIDGRMLFLHAGGVIAATAGSARGAPAAPNAPLFASVEAPPGMENFVLPEPPSGRELKEAVRASLGVLDLAPDDVTAPLLGMTYRAPLGGVDFGGHLAGQTGAGKSELAAVMQQHYGPALDARNLPGSWSSTANALEASAFSAKDALFTVDDYAPSGTANDIARLNATADRLLRAQGNGSARGRMRADGSLRPNKPPRGFVLSTGEDIPKGHSIRARTLILELEPGALDWKRLSEAQRLASSGVYAAAMAGFISWLAQDLSARTASFRADHAAFREALQQGGHKRTVDAGAQLLATLKTLLTFALEVGAVTEAEHAALWKRVREGVEAALEPQAALQAQSDPVIRFSELLEGLLVSGRAHVADATTGDYPGEGWGWKTSEVQTLHGLDLKRTSQGARIGWLDGAELYLEPSATFAELQKFARDQGETLPVTERILWKRLAERGIVNAPEKGHATVKRSFPAAGRKRVLHIPVSTLEKIGAIGAGGEDAVQDGLNPCPENETAKTESGQSGQQESRAAQRPESAPNGSGAGGKSGAQELASGTAPAPNAPIAPKNTDLETALYKQNGAASPDVQMLEELFKAGKLSGVPLSLQGRRYDDLERTLGVYFSRGRLSEGERADLKEIACAVAERHLGAN